MKRYSLAYALLIAALPLFGQSAIPLSLPAEQIAPITIDGYRLVTLDREKPVIIAVEGLEVAVNVPLFIYLPEKDVIKENTTGLLAIKEQLGRMAAGPEPIDKTRLLTLYLALERMVNRTATNGATVTTPLKTSNEKSAGERLESAIHNAK